MAQEKQITPTPLTPFANETAAKYWAFLWTTVDREKVRQDHYLDLYTLAVEYGKYADAEQTMNEIGHVIKTGQNDYKQIAPEVTIADKALAKINTIRKRLIDQKLFKEPAKVKKSIGSLKPLRSKQA
jgi:hypothetical protein